MKRKYEKRDLYKEVTQRFIDALKNGAPPWIKAMVRQRFERCPTNQRCVPAGNIPESIYQYCGQQQPQPAIPVIAG